MVTPKSKTGVYTAIFFIIGFGTFALFNVLRDKNGATKTESSFHPVPVRIEKALKTAVSDRIMQTGTIRSETTIDVYPKVPGKIIRTIRVESGDLVVQGQVIATLEDEVIQAKVRGVTAEKHAAEAGLKLAEARLEMLLKDKERMEALLKENAIAMQQVDHIQSEYKSGIEAKRSAEANIEKASAGLAQLEIMLRYHKITAPVSGRVTRRYLDAGAMSSTSHPVIRISSEDRLKIITTVSQKVLPDINTGMTAKINVDACPNEIFHGKVTIISPSISLETRTAEVEITLDNIDKRLKPGMFAEVNIPIAARPGIVVPREALMRLPGTGSYYLFIIKKNKAVQMNVDIGLRSNEMVEITKGLSGNEQVVVQGQNRLSEGDTVDILSDKPADQAQNTRPEIEAEEA